MAFKSLILAIAIMAVLSSMSHASDPSPLQDFCVAVDDSKNAGKLQNYIHDHCYFYQVFRFSFNPFLLIFI